jgi:hypothetical protein
VVADLPGIALVLAITIVAGGIAYIGDRVGHQVGRKRLTLFGLRPKYTSTIVAVATGMLIALSVTLAALIGSNYVRTAFFRIGQLNAQINQLQAQAFAQQNELNTTRNNNIVVAKGALVAPGVVIDVNLPETEQLRLFSAFFDDAVRSANVTASRIGLLQDQKRASDPQVRTDLLRELREARDHFSALGDKGVPLLFLPVAASGSRSASAPGPTAGSTPTTRRSPRSRSRAAAPSPAPTTGSWRRARSTRWPTAAFRIRSSRRPAGSTRRGSRRPPPSWRG